MCIFTIIANGFQKTAQPYLLTEMDGNSYIYISLYISPLYKGVFLSYIWEVRHISTVVQL